MIVIFFSVLELWVGWVLRSMGNCILISFFVGFPKLERKVSSIQGTDDDDKPESHINKKSATFSFSQNDIDSSTKAADKLSSNYGNALQSKTQPEIFRFLSAKSNFKVRKKRKLT